MSRYPIILDHLGLKEVKSGTTQVLLDGHLWRNIVLPLTAMNACQ